MCDWWVNTKGFLPIAISAFSTWLSRSRVDEAMRAEHLRKLDRDEQDRKFKELESTPRASREKVEQLRKMKANLWKKS